MRVIEDIDDLVGAFQEPVTTIGKFDGLHRGHRAVLEEVMRRAKRRRRDYLVVTFEPYPQLVLNSQAAPSLLTTKREKLAVMENLGVENLFVLPFTTQVAQMDAKDFVKAILLDKIGMKELVIGYDFALGRGRIGDLAFLKDLSGKLGFTVDAVPRTMVNGARVSSSRIRRLIAQGEVRAAAELLGRNYSVFGEVVPGDQRGRVLGFPTANLKLESAHKLLPADGVYAVRVKLNHLKEMGVMYVGPRPSFDGGKRLVEVHVMEFSEQIYGAKIYVEVVDRLRGDIRFSTACDLVEQIKLDIASAQRILIN